MIDIIKTMFMLHPGEIRSRSDGDVHYISARQLIQLYGIHPKMCQIYKEGWDRGMSPGLSEQFVHLYPRYDGEYQVNGMVNTSPDSSQRRLKSANDAPNKLSD